MTSVTEFYSRHGGYVERGGRYVASRPSMVGLTLKSDWSQLYLKPFKARKDSKPFNPQAGEIGSWVTDADGNEWQVWSLSGRKGYVWIANGRAFQEMKVS